MISRFVWVPVLLILPAAAHAEVRLNDGTTVEFATIERARELLARQDDFTRRTSPFDRAARMKKDRNVSVEEYLRFAASHALTWTDKERQRLAEIIASVRPALADFKLPLPAMIDLVKTTGDEEGGAAYTRGTAIVLPQRIANAPEGDLRRLFCHELFHVLSRQNAAWRDRLYATIGFQRTSKIPFPEELEPRRITNPDAPHNEHFIRVRLDDRPVCAVPILFARTAQYDPTSGGEFFSYLQFRLLIMSEEAAGQRIVVNGDGNAKLVGVDDVTGFYEQVGRNTGYVIHPEEILADNFSLLIVKPNEARSPEILQKMRAVLENDPPR
ncbi:MAG: hypothetical protein JJ992_25940, partial [Planctomycetes bacterium]|nr:hypothetical protein [Planctomycetota bacterium]